MELKINPVSVKSAVAALGALVLMQTSAFAQYDSRQAEHAANVRAIQAQRDQHAANVAALNGDYAAADAFAHAANIRRAQSYRDAGYARQLWYRGY